MAFLEEINRGLFQRIGSGKVCQEIGKGTIADFYRNLDVSGYEQLWNAGGFSGTGFVFQRMIRMTIQRCNPFNAGHNLFDVWPSSFDVWTNFFDKLRYSVGLNHIPIDFESLMIFDATWPKCHKKEIPPVGGINEN